MTDSEKNEDETQKVDGRTAPKGHHIRHLEVAVLSVSSFAALALRVNLSVAIIPMTGANNITTSEKSPYPVYDWDEEIQGLILSSFFWGYLMTQIPAGIITEKYGGHRFLCGAIFVSSAFTIIVPQCVYYGGWKLLCVNRMLQGISQGFVYPSSYTLLGLWVPPAELGLIVSITLSAHMLGTVTAIPIAGFLSTFSGWPTVFYWFGGVGVVVGASCYFLGADSPARHRYISVQERDYIQNSLGGAKKRMKIPWRNILTSPRVWATVFTYSFQAAVFLTFLTKIPTYLDKVHKFDMNDNGLVSSLPYLLAWFNSYIFSGLYNILTKRGIFSVTVSRKIFNSVAHFTSGLCMFLIPVSNNTTLSVALLVCSIGVMSASFLGVQANFVDLAPNFSGTVYSIGNFMGASLTVTGPIIVSFIVTDASSAEQWSHVYILCGTVMILSNLVFVFFGTAETQSWNWSRESSRNQPDDVEDLHVDKSAYIRRLSSLSIM